MIAAKTESLLLSLPGVSRGTLELWTNFANILISENAAQNLVATSTLEHIWERHILDSAQLINHSSPDASWLDLGSGAGLPGLVIACATPAAVTLVESRRLRADFLSRAAATLELSNVEVVGKRLELVESTPHDIITARAFAPLDRLLGLAYRFAHAGTRWLLPRGRNGDAELAAIGGTWQGDFRTVASLTDPDSVIVIADDVRPRSRR